MYCVFKYNIVDDSYEIVCDKLTREEARFVASNRNKMLSSENTFRWRNGLPTIGNIVFAFCRHYNSQELCEFWFYSAAMRALRPYTTNINLKL